MRMGGDMSDLIKQVGGIEAARKIIAEMPKYAVIYSTAFDHYFDGLTGEHEDIILSDLRQAIANYNTDTITDIQNHISPSTKVYDK